MSIASQITRIQGLVGQLRTNISNKGVSIANDANLATCVEKVNDISGGGQPTPTGYEAEYFTVTNTTNSNCIVSMNHYATNTESSNSTASGVKAATIMDIDYSFDKVTWNNVYYNDSSNHNICTLSGNQSVYLRVKNLEIKETISSNKIYYNHRRFSFTQNVNLSGNIMSLLYGDDFIGQKTLPAFRFYHLFDGATKIKDASNLIIKLDYAYTYSLGCSFIGCTGMTAAPTLLLSKQAGKGCFSNMFNNCTSLTDISNISLSATNIQDSCYSGMFRSCKFTTPPSLPATTLAEKCYVAMFYGCTSMTSLPTLAAVTLAGYCYQSMFYGCTSITNIPSNYLPATTLANYCYQSMFQGCTALTSTPNLSVTNFTGLTACYQQMFSGCSSLTTLPTLPATTLVGSIYQGMFANCTSLTTVPSNYLPATTLAQSCYQAMFQNCSNLTSAPELNATTLVRSCYLGMFQNCTSLVNAPALNSTSIADSCYNQMFMGCTSLVSAPSLPATTLVSSCYRQMFQGCTSLVNPPSLNATTLVANCYYAMFSGCTSLTTAPTLPATALISNCYYQMFYNCSNLNYIKAFFTTTPSNTYTNAWVQGVSATGTFVKNSSATWTTTGTNAAPSGWTIQYETP